MSAETPGKTAYGKARENLLRRHLWVTENGPGRVVARRRVGASALCFVIHLQKSACMDLIGRAPPLQSRFVLCSLVTVRGTPRLTGTRLPS